MTTHDKMGESDGGRGRLTRLYGGVEESRLRLLSADVARTRLSD